MEGRRAELRGRGPRGQTLAEARESSSFLRIDRVPALQGAQLQQMTLEGVGLPVTRIELQLDPEEVDRAREEAPDDRDRGPEHGEDGARRLWGPRGPDQPLEALVELAEEPALTAAGRRGARIVLRLADGGTREAEVGDVPGDPANPLPEPEVRAKFLRLAGHLPQAPAILARVLEGDDGAPLALEA